MCWCRKWGRYNTMDLRLNTIVFASASSFAAFHTINQIFQSQRNIRPFYSSSLDCASNISYRENIGKMSLEAINFCVLFFYSLIVDQKVMVNTNNKFDSIVSTKNRQRLNENELNSWLLTVGYLPEHFF